MGASAGPDIVDTGLVLALDAADRNSYPGSGTAWVDLGAGSSSIVVEYLVVAGGGGGSSGAGGGGGAGGLLAGSISLTSNFYSIVVGSGGTGAGSYPAGNYSPETSGGNSSFSNVIAIGGGSGGGQNYVANSGGSGGGGGGGTNAPSQQVAGIGTAGQGNSGASGVQNSRGGGGGGSGSAGSVVTGGSSTNSSISGTSTAYAGGGGAGTYSITAGNGGGGGAGNGTQGISVRGGDALANTGSGGGGGGGEGAPQFRTAGGGNGGSGIVIVRYQGPQRATGGTVTSVDGYTIHTFTTSGTFTTNMGNYGTLVNGVGYNSANFGSLVFDGTNDYAEITDSSNNFDLGGIDATLEFWIYIPSTSGADVIIGKGGNTANFNLSDGFIYQVQYDNTNNRFTFIYNNGGGAAGATFIGSGTQPINNWYQVVVVTTTANDIRFYVNTTNIVSATNAISKPTTRTRFRIGTDLSGNYTNARIPVVRFYKNRALSASEVSQNFNATRSRFGI